MKKLIYIAFTGLVLTACNKAPQQESKPIPVRVATVDTVECINTHSYVGHVESAQSAILGFSRGGRVTEVLCTVGQQVTKGQTLVKVDDIQQRNSLKAATAALQQAQDGYNRVQKVYSKGGVPEIKLIDIETKLKQAQSVVDLAQEELENTTLRAATNGVVSSIHAKIGQVLLPAAPVVEMITNEQMIVVIPVPETQISKVKKQDKGIISIPAVDYQCEGEVVGKDLTTSSPAHTYNVKLNILDSLSSSLLPDMVAKVQLLNEQQRGIVLPAECIQTHREGKSVWVIVDGKADRRMIETGMFTTRGVLITEGLVKGDVVVIDGYQKLNRGAEVQISEE